MRVVARSKTYTAQLKFLLEQGAAKFGSRVAAQKLDQLDHTLQRFLAAHPKAKRTHPTLKLRVYPISKTPFVVLYDFDDIELRVHFIVHRSADLSRLDPSSAEW